MGLTFASLFCGCGGFDLGFARAGFRCAGAFDVDPWAIRVHAQNLGAGAEVCDLSQGLNDAGRLHELDVLLSGSPCQGFSTVGKRRLDDPRNSLLLIGGRIARVLKPKVFIAENVAGAIAGDHRRYWDALRHSLRASGYRTAELLCEAHRLGVPQRRRRIVLVAWRRAADVQLVLPDVPGGVISSALKGLRGVTNHEPKLLPRGSTLAAIASRINPGQKLSNVRLGPRAVHTWDIPGVYGHTSADERRLLEALVKLRRRNRLRATGDADPVPTRLLAQQFGGASRRLLMSLTKKGYVRKVDESYDLTHTFNGKYRRLALDAPSPTVDTRFGDPRYFLHPTRNRGMTVREAARMQGFTDSFVFDGPERVQYRLIGNAVPPPMAYQIALWVRRALLEAK